MLPETIRKCSALVADVAVRSSLGPWSWAALIAVAVSAAATSARSAAATIGDLEGDASAPAAISSTSKSGSALKWLPAGPDAAASQSGVRTVQHTVPADSLDTLKPAPGPKPAGRSSVELFGDTKSDGPATVPALKPGDEVVPSLPLEPKARPLTPSLNSGEPAEKRPYLAPNGQTPSRTGRSGNGGALEREIQSRLHVLEERCPTAKDLKPIGELTTNITPPEGDLPHDCSMGEGPFQWRAFCPTTFAWTASALCHKPLYFEDVQLERYGHMCGPWLQPFASGVQFFATIPILPYEMGVELPTECIYTLGYYRPGDCAPYMLEPIPISVRGALFEAGAWVGGACLIH